MYAIIETGGKQYKVEKGDVLYIEKLEAEADEKITFDKVLAAVGSEGVITGTPYIEGAKVGAKVIKHGKGKKITVFTYVPKSGQKRKIGHRQQYTKVEITSVKSK